jgi:PAS domain S-box-containing protein
MTGCSIEAHGRREFAFPFQPAGSGERPEPIPGSMRPADTNIMRTVWRRFAVLQLVCSPLAVVLLCLAVDRQVTPRMNEIFIAQCEVATTSLAVSLEPYLAAGEMTSAQSVIDHGSGIPHLKWAYVTATDGKVLARTTLSQSLNLPAPPIAMANDRAWIRLHDEQSSTLVIRKHLDRGTVWAAFSQAQLLSSISAMKRAVFSQIVLVVLTIALAFSVVMRRMMAPVVSLIEAAASFLDSGSEAPGSSSVRSGGDLAHWTRAFLAKTREAAEQRETLEARVHERTEMLSRTNAELSSEMAECVRVASALRDNTELVMLLLDSAPEAIYGIDLEGDCTFCNPACLRMTGYEKPFELLGRNVHEVIHYAKADGTPLPVEECAIYRAFVEGIGTHGDDEVLWRKDGSSFAAEYWSRPLHRNDQVIGAVVTFVDITARKQVEETLRAAKAAAEAANRAKSQFLANMSHEIRTPLNGVIGMINLALATDLSNEQRELLETAQLSSDALLTVINDVLDFSKIEAGKTYLEARNFNLRDSLQETLKTFALRASEKQLALSSEIDEQVPVMVCGDAFRLRQIVVNLLGNAIKFTPAGRVALHVRVNHADAENIMLRFTISDTGVGISPNALKMIFEPFTQADSSTTRIFGGTGLGLAISARLVKMMGGEIRIESEPGRGSRFHFTAHLGVPAAHNGANDDTAIRQAQIATPAASQSPAVMSGSSLRVLLAEDNAVNRAVATKLLEKKGHHVVTATTGREALVALRRENYDVVLMDVQMPDMDGFETTRTIRAMEQQTGRHQQIIALTAHAMIGDRERCLEAGMDAYLTKPISPQQLYELLERCSQALDKLRSSSFESPRGCEVLNDRPHTADKTV